MKALLASPQLAALLAAWRARSARERRFLSAALLVVAIALLWTLHDGIRAERARLDRALPGANAQLKAMQEQAAELARLNNQPRLPKVDTTRQSEDIQAAAKAANLTVQVRSEGGRITVSGDAPQFNMVVTFLGNVQTALGLRSEMLDVGRIANGVHFELRLAPLN